MLPKIDDHFRVIGPMGEDLEVLRSRMHANQPLAHMIRQRIYQIAAGYEDCNDAYFLRIDPALRLAIGAEHDVGAGQIVLSRRENRILDTENGLKGLEAALARPNDPLMKRKKK